LKARTVSYADAVTLLGDGDSRLIELISQLAGGLVASATGGTAGLVVSLFDVKGELADLSGKLIRDLGDRIRGLRRYDRTQRLTAAHGVIVVTSYFEAVHHVSLPFPAAELHLTRSRQTAIATGTEAGSDKLAAVAGVLNDIPNAQDLLTPAELLGYYASVGQRLSAYLEQLDVWETLDPVSRNAVASALAESVPAAAARNYQEHLRQLAVDFPEVAFWTGQVQNAAVWRQLQELATGMEGLGRTLEQMSCGQAPDERREALSVRYARILQRPIAVSGDVPDGLVIPTLAAGYVSPRFRSAWAGASSPLDQEDWWQDLPVRDDLQAFLIRYLTSAQATVGPLVILGQPGSGKSVLTKILAARLPARDFLPVRVELREVPADTDLQSQIEYAVRDATGESLGWPALARTAGDALPVVLLDGFDELLQATGIGQTDYLEQIVRFQEREADGDRPVAVFITSRTVVADRARIPTGGVPAVRLEPFSQDQVRSWLAIWKACNGAYLESRGLHALSARAALRQPDLASQPLLLLLLALYDAPDNALEDEAGDIGEAMLYEKIFARFGEREVRKSRPGLSGAQLQAAIEQELLQLSIAAFAMFNRGRQWATEDELTADLAALIAPPSAPRLSRGFDETPTAAQLIAGRFFFIHQAQAIKNKVRLTACEFLHATFGEFLIARYVTRELADLTAIAALTAGRGRSGKREGFMRELLSFTPLTTRGKVIDFLAELLKEFTTENSALARDILLASFHGSLDLQDWGSRGLGPALSAPIRYASYSANLLLLTVLVSGPVTGRELFPQFPYPAYEWRRHAMLWRSQLNGERWGSLTRTLSLERIWAEGDRDVRIAAGPWTPPTPDPFWTHILPPGEAREGLLGWRREDLESLRRESYFTCDKGEDIAWHGLTPVVEELDTGDPAGDPDPVEATTAFGVAVDGQVVSVTNALLRLWTTSSEPAATGSLDDVYENCLKVIRNSRGDEDNPESTNAYHARVLRQLAADRDRLSNGCLARIQANLSDSILTDEYLSNHPAVKQWAATAFAEAKTLRELP